MSVTRYTCYYRDHLGYEGQALSKPDPDGEWVRWEDYCETVRKLVEGEPVAVPLVERIRKAEVAAGEQTVEDWMREMGLT